MQEEEEQYESVEESEIPNYLPVKTTPLLTSMNALFFKN